MPIGILKIMDVTTHKSYIWLADRTEVQSIASRISSEKPLKSSLLPRITSIMTGSSRNIM